MQGLAKLKLFGFALFGARLGLIAREKRLDHIHVHSCANAANIALFANLLSQIPYSLTLHGKLLDYGLNQKEKWAYARFAIVITHKLFDDVRAALGEALTKNVYIAPMGVNLKVFCRKQAYQAWTGQGPARIISVGRLNVCKGHAYLIQAVGILKDKGIPVHLKIAGDDEHGGSGYRIELQKLVDTLRLKDEVTLLGAVSENVVRECLSTSHIFSLASLEEPLGVAIMEAMALELPVVVTSAGGVKELVTDGKDGILVEPEDSAGLAKAIEALLVNPSIAERLSRASRQKIEDQFQDHRSAELLIRLAHS